MQALFRLRRYLEAPPAAVRKGESCELCGAAIEGSHGHVVDVESRRLLCTCRPCFLLFTHSGAGGGKFRSVSERVVRLADAPNGTRWEALEVPVGVAFFLRDSARQRVMAFYPSPAGATESGLPLETWDEMVRANPLLATLEPDTEALMVCRRSKGGEAWIVPVDACYELVGRIRRHWRGFEGGAEAWECIDEFFAGLGEREGRCT